MTHYSRQLRARVMRCARVLMCGTVFGCAHASVQPIATLTTLQARSGQPAWSPDGAHLAFVSNAEQSWQVWTVSVDDRTVQRLTADDGPVGGPSWTLSGDTVWYYAQVANRYTLRHVDLATRNATSVPVPGYTVFRPRLHPTGRYLLFDAVADTGGNHDVYVRDVRTNALRPIAAHPGYDSDAKWSPDGTHITFHSDRNADAHAVQVYVAKVDGSGIEQMTSGPLVHGYPDWSPNGRCLVYTEQRGDDRNIWLVELATRKRVQLTTYPGFDGDPAWHPRENTIAFATDRTGFTELALLDLTALVRSAPDIAPCLESPSG